MCRDTLDADSIRANIYKAGGATAYFSELTVDMARKVIDVLTQAVVQGPSRHKWVKTVFNSANRLFPDLITPAVRLLELA